MLMKVHPDHGTSSNLVQIAVDIFQQKLICRTSFFMTNILSMLPFIEDKQWGKKLREKTKAHSKEKKSLKN